MLKKVLDKRISQFKSDFPQYQVSKKTNSFYFREGVRKQEKNVKYNGRAITKGCINKIGVTNKWTVETSDYVYLLSQKGKLMYSKSGSNFKAVSLKSLRREVLALSNVFFTGRRYEWMKDYPNLWEFKFFQGFNSLNDAKLFLGYSFISDSKFASLFKGDYKDYLMILVLAENKSNAVSLLSGLEEDEFDTLRDYIEMSQDNGWAVEIPAGYNKLEQLHYDVNYKINEKNADNYSKEYKFDVVENFTKVWESRGLNFKRLETPHEMYLQGLKQHHCIGSNYATSLNRFAFYTFNFKGANYEIMLYQNGGVGQFHGKRNCKVPEELKTLVGRDVNLTYSILDVKPNLEGYPMIKESVFDEIPF